MKIIMLENAKKSSGGKAVGLALLSKLGVPVPNGFVINNTTKINFTEKEICKIEKFLKKLDKNKKLAIRSSALAEDGEKKSYAGTFKSEINVDNNIKSVLNAIKKVNFSINSEVVKAYSNNKKQIMNIIVQEMITPKVAGVLFTTAVDVNGDDVVLFECIEGLADKLVRGASRPSQVIFKIENNKISASNLRIDGKLMDLSSLKNIIPFINKIKKKIKKGLDIEWCIDENENPFFVQARPITSTVFINKKTENTGTIASRGFIEGETYVIDESKSNSEIKTAISNFKKGSILVAGVTETIYMPAIKKSSGIITEEGSALSHAAIVSRELGIPCISGYKDAIELFPTGTKITLDALNGKVTANGFTKLLDNKNGFEFGELYCFDNSKKINFKNFSVIFELTYGGLIVHMNSRNATKENLEILEIFSRKNFHDSPKQYFDDKYLWYLEIERFKKLPYFKEIITKMKEIVKEKKSECLDLYYSNFLCMLSKLVEYKNETKNNKEKLIINEIGALINLILDAMLPLGYAIRECYIDSLELLEKYNLNFNDLFISNKLNIKDKKLLKVQNFLNKVAINRNEIYEKICLIGATSPEYFEIRDEIIYKNCGFKSINELYKSLSIKDLKNIKRIMKPFI